MTQLIIFAQSLCQPTCDFFLMAEPWGAIQKHIFLLFTIYGVRHSSDGGLFFVWALQNRHHAGQRAQAWRNLSVRSLHPASAQDGWEGKRRKKATVKGVIVIMQKHYLSLNWITRINSLHRLDTFQITHKGFDRNAKKGFPLALSIVPSPVSDLKCHIRSY